MHHHHRRLAPVVIAQDILHVAPVVVAQDMLHVIMLHHHRRLAPVVIAQDILHVAPVVVAQDMLHVAPRLIVRTMWADVRQAVALDYTILMFTNKQAVEGLVP